jgi:hypothetical protein
MFPFNKDIPVKCNPASDISQFKTLFSELNDIDKNESNLNTDEQSIVNINCKYYDFKEFTAIPNKSKCFSALHLNIVSLGLHFDDLSTLLDHLQHSFGVIAITETKFTSTFPSINFSLPNFSTEHTPTESSAGGALLYISNKFTYKPRTDLTKAFYHSKLLESIFVELTQPRKKNIVVGSVYRHPKMSIDDFNYNYLSPLLDKVSSENKTLILLGDFNVDLLKSNTDHNISNFLDILGSNSVLPEFFFLQELQRPLKHLLIMLSSQHQNLTLSLVTLFTIFLITFLNSYFLGILDPFLNQNPTSLNVIGLNLIRKVFF